SRETGYPNDCPIFCYDFQSPLGEAGQMRESYVRLARLHQFLHAFGSLLAPMDTVLPDVLPKDAGDQNTLRCALRADENGGFLFVNNHIRLTTLPEHKNVPMEIEFRHRTVRFSMDIPSDACFVLPVSLTLASLPVTYATAQPVSVEEHRLTLEKIPGVTPVLALDDGRTFPLADGITIIDGTEVCLVSPEPYLPTPLTPLSATPAPDTISAQSLLGHLGLADRSTDYLVTWDAGTTYLVIRAQGNVAGFYLPTNDGWQLISDQYLYGDTWVMDVRRLPVREGRLKIQPFTPEDEGSVYLEIPFCAGTAVPEIYSTHEQFLRV
ncbi:MAG: hypothetical protein ACI4V1_03220, partial [Eubacteriales bacterium]